MAHRTFILFMVLCASQFCLAQDTGEQAGKANEQKIEVIEIEILVVDPFGEPVEEAEVYCTGLRTKANPASHYGWNPTVHGELQRYKTDERGVTKVAFPKFVREKLETGHVTWSVDHPDFVSYRGDVNVDDESPKLELENGFRIALNAVDGVTGEKIESDLHVLMGLSDGSGKWKLSKQGMLISPVYAPSSCTFRVLHLADGKPSAFSDLIEAKPLEGKSRVLLKDIKIFPGVNVKGNIDDSVPRPIKNGVAIAAIVNNPNEDREAQGSWKGRWEWNEVSEINEDGTFEFESLPRDEFIQVFIHCDGWTNARPKKEDVLKEFPQFERKYNLNWLLPHFEKLKGTENEITVPMIKNSPVTVTVSGPDGKPLQAASVSFFAQQLLFGGGGISWSYVVDSREQILKPTKDVAALRSRNQNRLSGKTDAEGKVELLAPPCNHLQVIVNAEGYQMAINGNSRSHRIDVEAGKSEEVTIEMVKQGSKKLGDN